MKIKICGLTAFDAVRSAVKAGADYVGFVFYPMSPRNITPQHATALGRHVPQNIGKVAVIVDASDDEIDTILKHFMPDFFQCHGRETVKRIETIKAKYNIPVIKAIPIRVSDDVAKGNGYATVADMLLFDAKVPAAMPGGNGVAFDWTLLKEREFDIPWFLSGGLNIQNVWDALRISGAMAVDASSSLEREPGVKDPELIELFIQKVRSYESQ